MRDAPQDGAEKRKSVGGGERGGGGGGRLCGRSLRVGREGKVGGGRDLISERRCTPIHCLCYAYLGCAYPC